MTDRTDGDGDDDDDDDDDDDKLQLITRGLLADRLIDKYVIEYLIKIRINDLFVVLIDTLSQTKTCRRCFAVMDHGCWRCIITTYEK